MSSARSTVNSALGLCILAAVAAIAATPSFSATITNGDFETGSFAGWTQNGGSWYGGLNYPADYTFTAGPYQSAIVTPGDVPCLAGKGVHVNQVYDGSYAARINSNDGGNYHFSEIDQTVNNWDASNVTLWWSAVLQDSGHPEYQRPHFRVMVNDLTSGTSVWSVAYYSDNLPYTQRTGSTTQDWSYTGWHQLQIDTPASTLGHTLQLKVLASDCAQGGHDGSLYVDDIVAHTVSVTNQPPVAVPVIIPSVATYGQSILLDGSGSYDAENDPITSYEWDLNGDGVAEVISSTPTFSTVVPGYMPTGLDPVDLRVYETLPGGSGQWSSWAPTTLYVTPVPEPSTILLFGVGFISLLGYACRRRRQAA